MHILVKQQRRNIANLRGHVTKMLTLLSALSARPLSAVNLLHCGWVNFQLKVEGPVHTLRVAADALPRHLALLRDNARCCETTRDNARRALSCDNARQSHAEIKPSSTSNSDAAVTRVASRYENNAVETMCSITSLPRVSTRRRALSRGNTRCLNTP